MLFEPYGWVPLLVIPLLLPFAVWRGHRDGGARGVVILSGLVLVVAAVLGLVPTPWGYLVVAPAVVAYTVTHWRWSMRAAVRGELVLDHTGIPLDGEVGGLVHAGFQPALALRLAGAAPSGPIALLLDPPGTTLASVAGRPGAPGRPIGFASVFEGGHFLRTNKRLLVPPPGYVLAQGFPGAPTERLLAEHRAALAWLAERGHRPVPLDARRAADLVAWDWRATGDRVVGLPWSAFLRMWWVATRRTSYCRGPVGAQPDIAERLTAWGTAAPAPP
jgi:hypothetical protein